MRAAPFEHSLTEHGRQPATHPATEHQLVLGLATEVAMSENSRKATLCHISAGNLLKLLLLGLNAGHAFQLSKHL